MSSLYFRSGLDLMSCLVHELKPLFTFVVISSLEENS